MQDCSHDYLLNKQVSIFQPLNGYRASTDAVFLASVPTKIKSGDSFLDIGSGTGAISLCLAARLQEYAPRITGLELQPELVELSNRSAEANGFARVNFRYCNIKELPADIPFCSFDHVISNPPYAEEDMPSPNPGKALAHNHQDFTLKEWVKFAIKMLKPRGRFYMINRAAALADILAALHGIAGEICIIPLFSKTGQTEAKRVIVTARKDSRAGTTLLRGITVHNPDGTHTPEAFRILREGQGFFDR